MSLNDLEGTQCLTHIISNQGCSVGIFVVYCKNYTDIGKGGMVY